MHCWIDIYFDQPNLSSQIHKLLKHASNRISFSTDIELSVQHKVKAKEIKVSEAMTQLVLHTIKASCHY